MRILIRHCFAIAILGIALVGLPLLSGPAPQTTTAPALHLIAGDIRPGANIDRAAAIKEALSHASDADDSYISYIVQFAGPVQPSWYAALDERAQILSYLPDFAFKIRIATMAIPSLWDLPAVVWAGPWQPVYKLSPAISSLPDQPVVIWLEADPTYDLSVSAHGLEQLARGTDYVVATGTKAQLLDIATDPHIMWIQPLQRPLLNNDVATGLIGAQPAWQSGLDGSGQLITVADTGIDTGTDWPQRIGDMHPDLDNRVAHIHSWPISPAWYAALYNPTDDDGAADVDYGHGTHVAGTIAGNGAQSLGQYTGVAPKAQLALQALEQRCEWTPTYVAAGFRPYELVGIPQDISELYQEAYAWDSRIHTNSWGIGQTSLYTLQSAQTDAFVWDHPDMCILFSVGNEGRDANADGLVDYGSIMAPATAKNIIAVGGTESLRMDRYSTYGVWLGDWFPVNPIRDDTMADAGIDGLLAMSGRGPTFDGRMAPHIVAPGSWIISVLSSRATTNYGSWGPVFPYSDDYHYLGGTSQSTPLAAGAVALVRQAYVSQGHNPSAALLKATLIQSATDIAGQYATPFNQAGPVPNMSEGWGALNLDAATDMSRIWHDDATTILTGQTITHTFDVEATPRPVKFTLVWSDAPADPQASVSLVNDLDLRVSAPDGSIFMGNAMADGWSVDSGMADRTNNVECVYLPISQAGKYTVTIAGYNVPIPGQRYALLVDLPKLATPRVQLPLVLAKPLATVQPTAAFTATPSMAPTFTVTPTATLSPTATCTPTPSYTPSPTVTPTLSPGEWREDFAVLDAELWTVDATEAYRLGYSGGAYRIELGPTKGQAGSLPARYQAGDYHLSVTTWCANDAPQAQGLLFACQEDAQGNIVSYLAFVVTHDGRCGIVRRDGSYLVGLTAWPVIHTGSDTNRLAVRRLGNEIICEVNGTTTITMETAEIGLGDRFGLLGKSLEDAWTDARFDDLWLLPLDEAELYPGRETPLKEVID